MILSNWLKLSYTAGSEIKRRVAWVLRSRHGADVRLGVQRIQGSAEGGAEQPSGCFIERATNDRRWSGSLFRNTFFFFFDESH